MWVEQVIFGFKAALGDGVAAKFMAHRKVAGQMPIPADILSGKVTELKTKEISAMYSLTVSMCYELKDNFDKIKKGDVKDSEWNQQGDNFIRFLMTNFTTELCVMGARMALTNFNLPLSHTKMKSFGEFFAKYNKFILAANK
mgnify:CR=1 FL=1